MKFKQNFWCLTNLSFKDEDIDRIIEEKNRFRAHPTNYAMKKTQLLKVRPTLVPFSNFSSNKICYRNVKQL